MAIQGLRNTANFVTDQRPKNWREGILVSNPQGSAPLFAMTSLMKKRSVDDPEFNWWEKNAQERRVALSANLTAGATSASVVSGALAFKKNDVFRVMQSEEVVRVTADPGSDTALPIQRGVGGTTPTAVTYNGAGVNPNMQCIGNAMEEGSLAPTAVQFDPSKVFNYTQIFRHTLSMTRTAKSTRLRTGDQVKEAKRETLEIHSMDIERALWFSQRQETTLNGEPLRYMGGIDYFMSNHDSGNRILTPGSAAGIVDTTGYTALNWDMEILEAMLMEAFRYGSSQKMGFAGNRAMLTLQQIARKNSDYQFMQGQKEFGMNVSTLITPFGELVLKTHPLFNQMVGGTTGGTAFYGAESWLWILDMAEFMFVHLKDGDTQFEGDIGANGLDGMKAGYLSELSMEFRHPRHHLVIKDLAGAAADS
jgi:hypothetical protein